MREGTGSHAGDANAHADVQALLANLNASAAFGVVTLDNVGALCADYGVEAAHQAIGEFARRTRGFLRQSDSSLILSDTRVYFALQELVDNNHLLLAALKLERLFQEPLVMESKAIPLQIHAGLVFCSEQILTADGGRSQLYDYVERAREAAVANGETFEIKSTDLLSDSETVPSINKAMLRAIDTHDITMDYQPKYRLADGALVGSEALVRWRRDGMIVPPNEFLPLLSDVALWDMTQYCLRCVVRDSLEFPTSLPMSINIDPVCLNSNLVALIKDELALWNVDPARLMLEITEAGVIQNHTESFELLQAIRALGIHVSIDDFGTGHSSMHRFRDMPADEIKLDRVFIHNIVKDEANQKMTDTLIELCHRFSKTVVAEGIEDGATVEYLINAGCDLGQGFYLGAPMGKERFQSLLEVTG